MPTMHLLIKGNVQGVFYRATAKERADKIGVTGWIKNTDAGDVEAVVSGSEKAVQQFIAWCRQGPPLAKVSDIEVQEMPAQDFPDFSVKRHK